MQRSMSWSLIPLACSHATLSASIPCQTHAKIVFILITPSPGPFKCHFHTPVLLSQNTCKDLLSWSLLLTGHFPCSSVKMLAPCPSYLLAKCKSQLPGGLDTWQLLKWCTVVLICLGSVPAYQLCYLALWWQVLWWGKLFISGTAGQQESTNGLAVYHLSTKRFAIFPKEDFWLSQPRILHCTCVNFIWKI